MLKKMKNHPATSNAFVAAEYVESELLKNSRYDMDPHRPVKVFMPKKDIKDGESFPVLYVLAAWTGAGRTEFDWKPFKESLYDRLVRLIKEGAIPECVVVAPDLYTKFGGSQYVNSEFFGPHGDYIVKELIPYIEDNYPVKKGSKHRGVFGRSSGGFGALRLAMDYPNTFNAVACHSGDLGFESVYKRDLIDLCNGLKKYSGDPDAFLEKVWNSPKVAGFEVHLMMLLGMCGFYSPDAHSPQGYELPIDLKTAVVDEEVWQKWLASAPLTKDDSSVEALENISCLYVECGNRDQYQLQYGARQLRNKLIKHSIKHVYYEFDDNHSGTSYRYDVSLPLMLEALR